MQFRTVSLAVALAAMTAMPVAAQEMQAPVDENAPLDGSMAVEAATESTPEPVADIAAVDQAPAPAVAAAPAPRARRNFMEKAAVAAGTLAAAYAAFEAMKALTKKKPAVPAE